MKSEAKWKIEIEVLLTVLDTIEAIWGQFEAVGAQASSLGRLLCELGRGHADVRASAVQRSAVIGSFRLAVRVVHVNHHGNLFLSKLALSLLLE